MPTVWPSGALPGVPAARGGGTQEPGIEPYFENEGGKGRPREMSSLEDPRLDSVPGRSPDALHPEMVCKHSCVYCGEAASGRRMAGRIAVVPALGRGLGSSGPSAPPCPAESPGLATHPPGAAEGKNLLTEVWARLQGLICCRALEGSHGQGLNPLCSRPHATSAQLFGKWPPSVTNLPSPPGAAARAWGVRFGRLQLRAGWQLGSDQFRFQFL